MQLSKNILRKEFFSKIKDASLKRSLDAPNKLLDNIMPLLKHTNKIAIYHAYGSEISLSNIIDYCLKEQKELYQPVSYKEHKKMLLMSYDPNQKNIFVESDYTPPNSIGWYNVDLVILPLLAVDKLGYRLGKGGGYYDTTLNDIKDSHMKIPKLCGVGYTCQIYSGNLPRDDFDVPLDYFVSEDGLINFR